MNGGNRPSGDVGMIFKLGVEEADGVFDEAERLWRWVLVRAVVYKQFLEPAGMEAHQQIDRLSRQVRVAVTDASRHPDKVPGTEFKRLLVEKKRKVPGAHQKGFLDLLVERPILGEVARPLTLHIEIF